MPISVRLATPADAPALARMRYAFRAAHDDPAEDETAFLERCSAWMGERLSVGGQWRAWVACEGDRVVGNLWLQLIEKLPNPVPELERHAYITNVYVDRAVRGGGAGRLLMEAALAFCRDSGVDSAILWPSARSRTLYARHGFVERPDDLMEAILDPGRKPVG